jgi:arylformamidase
MTVTANATLSAGERHAPWHDMTRAELDAAYNNSAHVSDSADRLARWERRSEQLRAQQAGCLNQRYGPRPRNLIDIFRCGTPGAPLLLFIHGGYWQRNSKEVFSCMAEGPLTAGFDVALPGYTLAPEADLTSIVAEIRATIAWLRSEGPALGVATGQLIASGWSAGGHLATVAMSWPEVDAGLSISGIYDLEPIRLGTLNDNLSLSRAEALALGPLHNLPNRAGPLTVAYGTAELPELQRQSRDFFACWTSAGLEGRLLPLEERNHFSILDELAAPGGLLIQVLQHLAR